MTRTSRRFAYPRRACFLALALAALACTSCGNGGRKKVFPVQGKVFYEGKPAGNAVVFLHPVDSTNWNAPWPQGTVGADGAFTVTTYQPADGAPAGKYAVTVIWKSPSPAGDSDEQNLLPLRYMKPSTSGLRIEVPEQATELPAFELKAR